MKDNGLLIDNGLFFAEVRRMLAKGCSVTIRAKGRSMYPFIRDGRDLIVLLGNTEVNEGDIVLAELPDKSYVLHRIYQMQGDEILLMGDGNLHSMERCRKDAVLGKAIRIIRGSCQVDCASASERRKAVVWRRLLPVRRYLLFALRLVKSQK